jgi:hypothetical protein
MPSCQKAIHLFRRRQSGYCSTLQRGEGTDGICVLAYPEQFSGVQGARVSMTPDNSMQKSGKKCVAAARGIYRANPKTGSLSFVLFGLKKATLRPVGDDDK